MQFDAVIVGAGIIGTSCAYFLSQAGLKVALVERAGIAAGTSGAGEGNILVSDKAPGPELELARQGRQLWETLAHRLPDDFEFEPKGGIVVAETPANLPGLLASMQALQAVGIEAQLLDKATLHEKEPHLAQDVAGAAWFPQDAQVQPMLACAAFAHAARRQGTQFFGYSEVQAISPSAGGLWRLTTAQHDFTTSRIINAAGPWSHQVAALAGISLNIQPRKGHILVTEPLPRLVFHKVFEASYADTVNNAAEGVQVASVVEGTQSGTILIGSSRQLAGFDTSINIEVLRRLAQRAIRYFPVLANVQALRAYVGFRPFTPDHLPIIGEHPEAPGFYSIGGHEGAGIGTGPISSLLLSQLILRQPPALDLAPFRPDRFARQLDPH